MVNDGFIVSGDAMNLVLVSLLYLAALVFSFRRLIPRLSPSAKLLAIGMMASQVFVIGMSAAYRPASSYEEWLWHLDQEFNIPSSLAFAQLAVCAGAALITAWLAKAMPSWRQQEDAFLRQAIISSDQLQLSDTQTVSAIPPNN